MTVYYIIFIIPYQIIKSLTYKNKYIIEAEFKKLVAIVNGDGFEHVGNKKSAFYKALLHQYRSHHPMDTITLQQIKTKVNSTYNRDILHEDWSEKEGIHTFS